MFLSFPQSATATKAARMRGINLALVSDYEFTAEYGDSPPRVVVFVADREDGIRLEGRDALLFIAAVTTPPIGIFADDAIGQGEKRDETNP